MTVLSDKWIRKMVSESKMISPFEDKQVSKQKISYGLSSYGYDIRVSTNNPSYYRIVKALNKRLQHLLFSFSFVFQIRFNWLQYS